MDTLTALIAIAGLAVLTLLSRGFFILPEREWPLPGWLRDGLRYAPLGALAAVLAPDLLFNQGQFLPTWRDARLFGLAAATAWFVWQRSMLGTILSGTGVMLLLRLGLGW